MFIKRKNGDVSGRRTFRSRVFFPIFFLVLATIGSMEYLYVLRQSEVIGKNLEKKGESLAAVLAKNLKIGLLTRSDEYIDEAVKSAVDVDDVLGIRVYDSDGKMVRDIGKKGRPQPHIAPTRELFDNNLSSRLFPHEAFMELAAPVYYVESGIARSDLELYPAETGKKVVIGYLVLSLSKGSIVSASRDVRNLAIFTAVLFCFFSGLIAYYIASSVTLPLSELVKNIRDMQVHGLRSLPVRGPYEIRELSVAFNIMAETIDKRERELHSLASELSLTEERERHRIATDLHDNIGQTLALSKIKLGMLGESVSDPHLTGEVTAIRNLIDQSIQYSRMLMFDLSSPVLYELGLVAAMEQLTARIGEEHGLKTSWENSGQQQPMDNKTRLVLYKAVRELLMNVAKHAQTKKVAVLVRTEPNTMRIRIEDEGVGFDTSKIEGCGKTLNGCFGLFNVRERLKDIGGVLVIESSPGQGTRATIDVPFMTENHGHEDSHARG
jgi:signal transduction histidine kinase